VVAQRLVRVLNSDSRIGYPAGDYEARLLNLPPGEAADVTLYRPGTDSAGGYQGRTGIYELVVVDERMRAMIHDGAGEHELERHARRLTPGIRDDDASRY
jgi:general secretion pathway protein E